MYKIRFIVQKFILINHRNAPVHYRTQHRLNRLNSLILVMTFSNKTVPILGLTHSIPKSLRLSHLQKTSFYTKSDWSPRYCFQNSYSNEKTRELITPQKRTISNVHPILDLNFPQRKDCVRRHISIVKYC